MTQFQNYAKALADMASSFPLAPTSVKDTYQKAAENFEQATSIALNAASEVVAINDKWAKDTLARAKEVSRDNLAPEHVTKTFQDYASASWETSAQYLASYTEIARKAQMDAVELALGSAK